MGPVVQAERSIQMLTDPYAAAGQTEAERLLRHLQDPRVVADRVVIAHDAFF